MINVRIIADSCSSYRRVTTFELEYPRYIHSELMTHRVFSRNAASSRAIPIKAMIEQVRENAVFPKWTQNQAGMQGKTITNAQKVCELNDIWVEAAENAISFVEQLADAGAHKQNANRILEPFQHIKVVVTATEFENFFNLRFHEDAQPEIRDLACEMLAAYSQSKPKFLTEGEWHLPYADGVEDLELAKKVSASCCAQVSYRKNDASEEKAELVYDRLVGGKPLHASPFEHQCTPYFSGKGNLVGFRQLRQDIEETFQ